MVRLDGLPGHQFSILRQELDSMIRVIYLLKLSVAEREVIARSVLDGRGFCDVRGRRITDRDMLLVTQTLHGWARSVYTFGCAFIHLSSLHAYQSADPLEQLTRDERRSIADHVNHYHGSNLNENSPFRELTPFLPRIFKKTSGNLSCYLESLHNGESLESP